MAITIPSPTSSPTSSHPPNPPRNPRNFLKILQWNCNSILPKLPELKMFLNSMDKAADVICLQETYLKEGKTLSLPNYNIERADRKNGNKGGVATLIKKEIPYSTLPVTEGIEEISITIKLHSQPLVITNVYNPPGNKIDKDLYNQLTRSQNIFLLGDFNAHSALFGGTKTNEAGKDLEEIIDENNLIVLNDRSGTHIKQNGELSAIDITITNPQLSAKCNWSVHCDSLGSDHYPIITTINEPPDIISLENNAIQYNYRKADWIEFKNECRNTFGRDLFNEDVNLYSNNITNAIHSASENTIPKCKKGSRIKKGSLLEHKMHGGN